MVLKLSNNTETKRKGKKLGQSYDICEFLCNWRLVNMRIKERQLYKAVKERRSDILLTEKCRSRIHHHSNLRKKQRVGRVGGVELNDAVRVWDP